MWVREYGKAIYESDLLNVIGADVPRNKLDEIKRIDGVEKVSFPRKADILN